MRKIILLSALMLSAALSALPRLTVVVHVDGLGEQHVEWLNRGLPGGGLTTIAGQSPMTLCTYPHELYGGGEALATLLTGTTPNVHGYSLDHCFSRADHHLHLTLEDKTSKGIGTPLQVSPRALLVPSLTDQVRLRYGADARIYAVGIDMTHTLLMAGHAANGCCWLDAEHIQWATTNYYGKGLHNLADEFNIKGELRTTLEQVWAPLLPNAVYTVATREERKRGFCYYGAKEPLRTPYTNLAVIRLATGLIRAEQLGQDDTPDILCLDLNLTTPAATSDLITRAEQEDMLLCLNRQMATLLDSLNEWVGPGFYNVVLTGTPRLGLSASDYASAGLRVKTFDNERACALLNTYLMVLYGNGQWVEGSCANAIFLNHNLIAQKRLSLTEIQTQAATFLTELEGVQSAYTARECMLSPLATTLSKQHLGDVVYIPVAGWQICEDALQPTDHILDHRPRTPLWIYSTTHHPLPTTTDATTILSHIGL